MHLFLFHILFAVIGPISLHPENIDMIHINKGIVTYVGIDNKLDKNYIPTLIKVNPKLTCKYTNDEIKVDYRILEPLNQLIKYSQENGINICINSAYRSYEKQECLYYGISEKQDCKERPRIETATLPGASEHQLGIAVDFKVIGDISSGFNFLKLHALDFGFIQSYPKGNKYDLGNGKVGIYEDWHWRYIGKENINLFRKFNYSKDPQKILRNFYRYKRDYIIDKVKDSNKEILGKLIMENFKKYLTN